MARGEDSRREKRHERPAEDDEIQIKNKSKRHVVDYSGNEDQSSQHNSSSSSSSGEDDENGVKRMKTKSRKRKSSSRRRYSDSESESESSESESESESSESESERRRRKRRERKRREEKQRRREKEKKMKKRKYGDDDDSDDDDDEKRRRRKKKEKREKDETSNKKKKKKRRREKEKRGKTGAVTNSWGKYGVVREVDMWNKRPEFTAWLSEVKQVNLESLPNRDEKIMFKEYMEDYNTATFPSKKYYDLDAYHRQKMEKQMKKGLSKITKTERIVFDDEEQRRQELLRAREKQKEQEVVALKDAMKSGMAQAMKEQVRLKEEMVYLYKIGNVEAAAAIQKKLDPDVAM